MVWGLSSGERNLFMLQHTKRFFTIGWHLLIPTLLPQVPKARSIKTCMSELGVEKLDRPAQSTDLNLFSRDCEPGIPSSA